MLGKLTEISNIQIINQTGVDFLPIGTNTDLINSFSYFS